MTVVSVVMVTVDDTVDTSSFGDLLLFFSSFRIPSMVLLSGFAFRFHCVCCSMSPVGARMSKAIAGHSK